MSDFFNTITSNNFIIGGDFYAKKHSWGCQDHLRGLILHDFVTRKNLKVLAPPGPTYWPTSICKNPNILNIFGAKIPNNIDGNTANILDLNSDHSSVILSLNISFPLRCESPKLFDCITNKLQFRNLVDHRIKLNVKLKSKDDLDSAINNFTNIIQLSAWSSSKPNTPPLISFFTPAHICEIIVKNSGLEHFTSTLGFPHISKCITNYPIVSITY